MSNLVEEIYGGSVTGSEAAKPVVKKQPAAKKAKSEENEAHR